MAKGFEIGVGVDTKAAKQAIDAGLVEPFEDAQAELKKLGDSRGPEDLERSLREAQRETEDLADETEDTARTIEREYRDAYRDMKRAADDGMRGSGEAIREFRGEAIQNLSEVASSFDGSIEGIADGFQGLAGGASAGLIAMGGPAAAAGAALAGVGLVGGAMFTKLTEDSERTREIVSTNFQQMAQDGIEAWRSLEAEQQRLTEAYDEHEGEIKAIADLTGLSFEQIASAWAGNQDALAVVNAAYAEMKQNLRETPGVTVEAAQATIAGWDAVVGKVTSVNEAYATAQEKAERLAKQQSDALLRAARDAGTALEEVDELGNRILTLPDSTKIFIDADTGRATLNIEQFKGDVDGIPETVTTTAIFKPDTSALDRALEGYRNARVTVRADVVDRYGAPIR